MSSEYPDAEIVVKTSRALTGPATKALTSRGLSDLDATERADKWLASAWEHYLRPNRDDHDLKAYFDCLQHAVAAKPDHPEALIRIAGAYARGEGVVKSRDECLRHLRAAEVVSSPALLCSMGFLLKIEFDWNCGGLWPEGWPEGMKESVRMFRKAAEQGHAQAQHTLGIMYVWGEGVSRDDKLALFWFSKAAENGEYPPAQDELESWRRKS